MCTFKCCGIFCSGLSVFCGLSLLIVGIFLWFETRSIYVPIKEGQTSPDYHSAALNCFVGAIIYAVLLVLSIGCICYGRFKDKRAQLAELNSRPLRPQAAPDSAQ